MSPHQTIAWDFGTLIQLIGRKLKGTTSAADNDDCNQRLREEFSKVDTHFKAGEVLDEIDDVYWEHLRGMLWRWKGGEDTDDEERFELHDWVGDLKKAGAFPTQDFPGFS